MRAIDLGGGGTFSSDVRKANSGKDQRWSQTTSNLKKNVIDSLCCQSLLNICFGCDSLYGAPSSLWCCEPPIQSLDGIVVKSRGMASLTSHQMPAISWWSVCRERVSKASLKHWYFARLAEKHCSFEVSPIIQTLRKFKFLVSACFGNHLDDSYAEKLSSFQRSYLQLQRWLIKTYCVCDSPLQLWLHKHILCFITFKILMLLGKSDWVDTETNLQSLYIVASACTRIGLKGLPTTQNIERNWNHAWRISTASICRMLNKNLF